MHPYPQHPDESPDGAIFTVAPGVTGLRTVFVNVFFISDPEGKYNEWVLVDAGLKGFSGKIISVAEKRFGKDNPPAAIIMTHGHFDHRGSLKELLKVWKVPVFAHKMERPYLTGISAYPPPDPTVDWGGMALSARLYPADPIDIKDNFAELPADGTVPGLPDWHWLHTPGHSPGHVSFFRSSDRLLIGGDAFVTTRQESVFSVATQRRAVNGPPAYFTPDWKQTKRSIEQLAALDPQIAACGHGLPMRGDDLFVQLQKLLNEFEDKVVPSHGRYVKEPARFDETGVTYIPPRVNDLPGKVYAGLGIAALVGGAAALAWRKWARGEKAFAGGSRKRRESSGPVAWPEEMTGWPDAKARQEYARTWGEKDDVKPRRKAQRKK